MYKKFLLRKGPMAEALQQQSEEREALQSIYEGDEAYKELDATTYQYKYGAEEDIKSFLVEIKWTDTYPSEVPIINMDTFYNRNLIPAVKNKIRTSLLQEANQWLGCGMTYTLFESIKDRLDELTSEQPDTLTGPTIDNAVEKLKISDDSMIAKTKDMKKERLTKAQKRRQWDRADHKGERPRGHDWVDIVKHLSQTGKKDEEGGSTNNMQIYAATNATLV